MQGQFFLIAIFAFVTAVAAVPQRDELLARQDNGSCTPCVVSVTSSAGTFTIDSSLQCGGTGTCAGTTQTGDVSIGTIFGSESASVVIGVSTGWVFLLIVLTIG